MGLMTNTVTATAYTVHKLFFLSEKNEEKSTKPFSVSVCLNLLMFLIIFISKYQYHFSFNSLILFLLSAYYGIVPNELYFVKKFKRK